MRPSILATAALTSMLVASSAAGQPAASGATDHQTPLSLEELMTIRIPVVHGASRFAQEVIDAPSSITIVTREEIARFGYRTMADLLRGVRGFYVTYDRNYAYVGTRGLARPGDYNARILVLINGHRVNENVFDATLLETGFPVDIELVDRVEIVRGPSSSLYGTSAFFAVVNVLTHTGASDSGVRSDVGVASLGTRTVRVSAGRLFGGGAQALVSASTYHSDGQSGQEAGGAARGMDEDDASRLFGTIAKGAWSAQAAFVSRRKRIPTGAFETVLDDPRTHTVDMRAFAGVAFDRMVRETQVTARAYHDWYDYDGTYVLEAWPLFKDNARGRWGSLEVQALRRWHTHRVTAGVDVTRNARQDQLGWYETDPVEIDVDDRRQSTNSAIFAQDEWRLAPWALVNAGVRHDRYPLFGEATSPRAALILKPSPTSAIKLLHGRAFRAPNMYESFYYSATETLRPERITTNELVVEVYEQGGARVTVSGFVYRIGELITQSSTEPPDAQIMFVNVESVRSAGVEVEAERAWRGGWHTAGSYTRQQVLEGISGEILSNSPGHTAALRAAGPLVYGRVSGGLEVLYTSGRATVHGTTIPAYALANLTIRAPRPVAGLIWSLHVNNLFDARYFDPGTPDHPVDRLRQDGRTWLGRVTWRF